MSVLWNLKPRHLLASFVQVGDGGNREEGISRGEHKRCPEQGLSRRTHWHLRTDIDARAFIRKAKLAPSGPFPEHSCC